MRNPNGRFAIIRNALNCTQQELANYLGITRSHLTNVENGRRQLPDLSAILMNHLFSIILNAQPHTAPEQGSTAPDISNYVSGLHTQLQRMEKQLQETQEARKKALEAAHYVAAIRAAGNADENLDAFLRVLEASLQIQLYKHSANAIAMLQAKIKATRAAWIAVADDTGYDV